MTWPLVTAIKTGRFPLLLQRLKENAITEGEILHEERKGRGGKIWLRDTEKYGKTNKYGAGIQEVMEQPFNLSQRVQSGMSNKKVKSVTKVKWPH